MGWIGIICTRSDEHASGHCLQLPLIGEISGQPHRVAGPKGISDLDAAGGNDRDA